MCRGEFSHYYSHSSHYSSHLSPLEHQFLGRNSLRHDDEWKCTVPVQYSTVQVLYSTLQSRCCTVNYSTLQCSTDNLLLRAQRVQNLVARLKPGNHTISGADSRRRSMTDYLLMYLDSKSWEFHSDFRFKKGLRRFIIDARSGQEDDRTGPAGQGPG